MSSAFLTPYRIVLLTIVLLYSAGFYAIFIIGGNSEFVWYILQIFAFIGFACIILSQVPDFPDWLLTALVITILMHVAGGGVYIHDKVLYSLNLIEIYKGMPVEFYILKYDQVIHFFGFGFAALAFRYLIAHATNVSVLVRSIYAFLATMGLGALNEVGEFIAVLMFVHTYVGGFYNVMLDLTFNMLGAVIALITFELFTYWKKRSKYPSIQTTPE